MTDAPNIVLIGFMGTGKTSVGHRLASRLGLTFVDMDHVIEQRQGCAISELFATRGEPFFRSLERDLVRELAGRRGLVIGTGGGIVLNPDNVADFARTGLVVCLKASPETILRRVEHDTTRPLLAQGDKAARIRDLLAKRQALYDAAPNPIDTDALGLDEVVETVIRLYRQAMVHPPCRRQA